MATAVGYQAQLGISASNPVDARFDFQRESLVCDEEFIDTNGLRGTRSRDISRVRAGNRRMHGQIVLQPSSAELALLFPWILGTAGAGSPTVAFALADAAATRYVTVDRVSKVFTYAGVAVDRATFRGREGQPLEVTLDLVGQTETVGNSGTFPALSIDTATQPFVFTDLAVTVATVAYEVKEIELVIDNAIDKERFFNSQTLSAVHALDRHVMFNTRMPYGTASAVYNTGSGGAATVLTFTGPGTQVLTFSMVKVAYPRKSPSFVEGRAEELIPLQGIAYKSSSTLELETSLHQ